jgi:hypothetical protein
MPRGLIWIPCIYLNLYVLKWFGVKFTINLTLNHFNICRFDWDEYMTIKQVSSSCLPALTYVLHVLNIYVCFWSFYVTKQSNVLACYEVYVLVLWWLILPNSLRTVDCSSPSLRKQTAKISRTALDFFTGCMQRTLDCSSPFLRKPTPKVSRTDWDFTGCNSKICVHEFLGFAIQNIYTSRLYLSPINHKLRKYAATVFFPAY